VGSPRESTEYLDIGLRSKRECETERRAGNFFRSNAEHAEHAEFVVRVVVRGPVTSTACGVARSPNKKRNE